MSRRVGRAVLAFVSSLGSPAESTPLTTSPVTLVWVDPTSRAGFAADGAIREATAMLAAAGAAVRWRRTDAPMLLAAGELAVIVVAPPPRSGRTVMGSTQLDAAVPAVWVHPDTVAGVLGLGRLAPGAWTPGDRRGFERALGRVVAHEVVHAVLASPRHASVGLMSRSLLRRDLLAPSLRVDTDTRRAVDRAVADPYRWTSR
jgi:hypothetical protein